MERDEIIKGLYQIKNWKCNGDAEMHEVIASVIRLLEQSYTTSDTISRQAAIDEVEEWIETYTSGRGGQRERDAIKHVISGIKKLPSAQPEQRWIPCSETVDIPDHEVMACDRYGAFIIGYLDCKDEQWLCESDDSIMYDPAAWCELPKPYKEGGADG